MDSTGVLANPWIGYQIIEMEHSAVYLWVTIATKLTFAENFRKTTEKASIRVGQHGQLMEKSCDPRPQARRLFMSTIYSILLNGAEVWEDASGVQKYSHGMEVVQKRKAIRTACSYRTVSGPAVIANVVLIDLLAFEQKRTYDQMRKIKKQRANAEVRESTLTM